MAGYYPMESHLISSRSDLFQRWAAPCRLLCLISRAIISRKEVAEQRWAGQIWKTLPRHPRIPTLHSKLKRINKSRLSKYENTKGLEAFDGSTTRELALAYLVRWGKLGGGGGIEKFNEIDICLNFMRNELGASQ